MISDEFVRERYQEELCELRLVPEDAFVVAQCLAIDKYFYTWSVTIYNWDASLNSTQKSFYTYAEMESYLRKERYL